MSNIQKILSVFLLMFLLGSCTDEMMDNGGGTTPVEEGQLVNVNFVLGGAKAQTVVTKADPDEPDADDELLFLQYKKNGEGSYKLCHAWYTSMDKTDGFDDDKGKELEGFGSQSQVTVKNVQLLSGKEYIVYVLSNYKVDENNIDIKGSRDEGKKYHGVVNNALTVLSQFSTPEEVKSFTHNNKSGRPTGEEYMFARAYTGQEQPQAHKVKNFDYTRMLTNTSYSEESFVNSVEHQDTPVAIGENTSLCATFYVPYAAVSLTIDATGLNEKVRIKLSEVKIVNCPKYYSLVNGYSLKNEGNRYDKDISEFYNDGEDINTSSIVLRKDERFCTVKKYKTDNDRYDEDGYYWIYENMAGILDNADGDQKLKVPAANEDKYYTYIEVKGKYIDNRRNSQGEDITYRFILGNDNYANCNVERNVHYKVTMTLSGDGIGEGESWRVEYEGKDDPQMPPTVTVGDLTLLDAHPTEHDIQFTGFQKGTYYIMAVKEEDELEELVNNWDKNYKPNLTNPFGGKFTVGTSGNSMQANTNSHHTIYKLDVSGNSDFSLTYTQLSWFEEISTPNFEAGHNVNNAETVAQAGLNSYYLYVYSSDGTRIKEIPVIQYPPIVISLVSAYQEENENYLSHDLRFIGATYIERFDRDHNAQIKNDWHTMSEYKKDGSIYPNTYSLYNYDVRIFDQNDKGDSEKCYWLNTYGPLGKNTANKGYKKVSKSNGSWTYDKDIDDRYVIQDKN